MSAGNGILSIGNTPAASFPSRPTQGKGGPAQRNKVGAAYSWLNLGYPAAFSWLNPPSLGPARLFAYPVSLGCALLCLVPARRGGPLSVRTQKGLHHNRTLGLSSDGIISDK